MNVIWFRNDLRILDNPALFEAMTDGPCIALYCITQEQWDNHGLSQLQRDIIFKYLIEVEKQLSQLNVPLITIDSGNYRQLIVDVLDFCQNQRVQKLFYNHHYEVNEKACEFHLKHELKLNNIDSFGFHDQCIIPPGTIVNGSGQCYKVYTAFNKKWYSSLQHSSRPLYLKPSRQGLLPIQSDLSRVENVNYSTGQAQHWSIVEAKAHEELDEFIRYRIHDYHNERDYPSLKSTSQLSVYLAIGVLSTRQCLQAIFSQVQENGRDPFQCLSEGEKSWLNELAWREFYRNILYAFPKVGKNKPFLDNTESIPWSFDHAQFTAWCEGKTGVPIVDAAMRQLNTTGWMHNRLRMVVAMFLTKHLLIDWRLGEAYFYSQLADADFASNNGGWQWCASTGVDAVPYFRIFNPYRQAERFDPNGDFVRKYVKELSPIKGKAIHKPTNQIAEDLGYPLPLVDLKMAADRTKAEFKKLKR